MIGLILTRVITLFLVALIALGLSVFILSRQISGQLLDRTFYGEAFDQIELYENVYQEILNYRDGPDEISLRSVLLVVPKERQLQFIRSIFPPSYVEEEVRRNVDFILTYLTDSSSNLDLYIDLRTPLDLLEPSVDEYALVEIGKLNPDTPVPEEFLSQDLTDIIVDVNQGILPASLPSMHHIDVSKRVEAYDAALEQVRSHTLIPLDVSNALELARPEIIEALERDDSRSALSTMALSVINQQVEIERTRLLARLGNVTRYDLIASLADYRNQTKGELEQDIDRLKRGLFYTTGLATLASLIVVALGTIVLAVMNLPNYRQFFWWLAAALMVPGLIFLGVGLLLRYVVTMSLNSICVSGDETTCHLVVEFLLFAVQRISGEVLIHGGFSLGVGCLLFIIGGRIKTTGVRTNV